MEIGCKTQTPFLGLFVKYKWFYAKELINVSRRYSSLNVEFARYPLLNCFQYFNKIKDKAHKKEILQTFTRRQIFNNSIDHIMRRQFLVKFLFSHIKYYPTNIMNWDIDFQNILSKY